MEELKERGIGTSVHFIPLYRHPYYRDTFGCTRQGFPVSESIYEQIVSLPIYPGMTDGDIERVADSVRSVVRRRRR
jgi:dTDP-4-amino-4,6-dideoxygalactose transaminase